MRYLKILVHSILLLTTPFLLHYPIPVHAETVQCKKQKDSILSYDEILYLLHDLENGELEKRCNQQDLDRINQFLVVLAKEGLLPKEKDEKLILNKDIEELIYEYENPYTCSFSFDEFDEAEILLCKKSWTKRQWRHTRKFVKKHKKAILIGAAVVVAATIVVYAVAAASTAGAVAAGAASSGCDKKGKGHSEPKNDRNPVEETQAEEIPIFHEAPVLEVVLEERLSTFKETMNEDVVLQQNQGYPLEEAVRDLGSFLTHEVLEGVAQLVSVIPQLQEEIKEIGSRILPESILQPADNCTFFSTESHEDLIAAGHQKIDQVFATNQAPLYTLSQEKGFTFGILPPPGNFSKGINASKFREAIKGGQEVAVLSEELGFASREIVQLENAGALEKTVSGTFESIVTEKAMIESVEKFKNAREFLKPYKGQYLSEMQARDLIHQTGIKTFSRPNGIPENFRIKISGKGAGIKYVHPENEQTYIRVMPGKPHSPFPYQRKPYVVAMKDGKTLDKFGNIVRADSIEAHIPMEEFSFR